MTDHPLADILSITTGRLVSRDRMDGVYRILNDLTGDDLMTHQLGRAAEACAPVLVAQYPFLADVQPPPEGCPLPELWAWLEALEQQHGMALPTSPLGVWERRNPVEELCDMIGAERVHVAGAGREAS